MEVVIATSASSAGVPGLPASPSSRPEPIEFTGLPLVSGVPTVSCPELRSGAHDGYASGAPCVLVGVRHCSEEITSGTRSGVAPFGRGKPGVGPFSTSRTVLTSVPLVARGWSQFRNALIVAALTDEPAQLLQMSWKTIGTQPPPLLSAWVTKPSRSARVYSPA